MARRGLSTCRIGGIVVSDSFRELHDATIDQFQAIELVGLLGVRIK